MPPPPGTAGMITLMDSSVTRICRLLKPYLSHRGIFYRMKDKGEILANSESQLVKYLSTECGCHRVTCAGYRPSRYDQ